MCAMAHAAILHHRQHTPSTTQHGRCNKHYCNILPCEQDLKHTSSPSLKRFSDAHAIATPAHRAFRAPTLTALPAAHCLRAAARATRCAAQPRQHSGAAALPPPGLSAHEHRAASTVCWRDSIIPPPNISARSTRVRVRNAAGRRMLTVLVDSSGSGLDNLLSVPPISIVTAHCLLIHGRRNTSFHRSSPNNGDERRMR